eukprot:4882819-Pyramimonas_sp.AAC.1
MVRWHPGDASALGDSDVLARSARLRRGRYAPPTGTCRTANAPAYTYYRAFTFMMNSMNNTWHGTFKGKSISVDRVGLLKPRPVGWPVLRASSIYIGPFIFYGSSALQNVPR